MPDNKNKVTIIGKSPSLLNALKLALKAAKTDFAILISGESGVGKELFASFIHKNSKRSDKVFNTVNCAALPESMLESELFGHDKWAFTGANLEHAGIFEATDGGTLFLDEIGEMSITTQAKILRVLQNKEVKRLGSNKTIYVDVRVIAATNKNIDQMVAEGKFRDDLFFRLNVFTLIVPPLKDRSEDIPEIAEYILGQNCRKKYFHPQTLKELTRHRYDRNNVRELENIIKEAIVWAGADPCIKPTHLKFRHSLAKTGYSDKSADKINMNIAQNVAPMINVLVQKAMDKHCGKKSKAAKELGISVFLLKRHLKDPNISSHECLQYIQTDNKENKKSSDVLNLPHKKSQEQRNLSESDAQYEKIIEIAKRKGQVTNNMVQNKLRIAPWTAKRLLSSLAKRRILAIKGSGRGSCYVLSSISKFRM